MNKRGGGQISGNYGCRTEKRKKIEMKRVSENSGTTLNAPTSSVLWGARRRREREGDRKNISRDNSQKLP